MLAGCAGFVAYVLVLAAYRLAPAAVVSAVRETSVLFAVALAAPVLRERVPPSRLAGAVLVVAAIALAWPLEPTALATLPAPHFTGWAKWARGAHLF